MSTEVTVTDGPNLPALASTPALDIDSSAISLPRLYRGEFQAGIVQEGLAPAGSVYIASSADDPDPEVLIKDATAAKEEGVLVHILAMSRNKSAVIDGELQSFAFNDPSAPDDARVGYNYIVALPEVDPDVPVKLLLNKSSEKVAKRINFLLAKNQGKLQAYELAFRLKLKKVESDKNGQKNRWFVWVEKQVEADPKNVAIAAALVPLATSGPANNDIERSAGTEPAI